MTPVVRSNWPLISVIMPVWRPHQAWLTEAVSSVLAEQHCALELIVVDDGCEQPVAELLEHVSDPRLRVVRIDHQGHAAARNAGVSASVGAWLRFVDADDVVAESSTSHLATLMSGDRIIVYGATLMCDDHLQPYSLIASTLQGDVVAECLLGRFETRHVSMLFPRRTIDAGGPWDPAYRAGEDWDFVLRALEHAEARGDQTVATLYRRHSGSVSRTAAVVIGEESRRRIIGRYFARHPAQRGSALERAAYRELYLDRGRAYLDARDYRSAARCLAGAVRADPVTGAADISKLVGARVRRKLTRSLPSTGVSRL